MVAPEQRYRVFNLLIVVFTPRIIGSSEQTIFLYTPETRFTYQVKFQLLIGTHQYN